MIFEEKTISQEMVYEGKILNLRRDKVKARSGESTREVIEHNGAVAMVVITSDKDVVLVKQFRYCHGMSLIELPAGKINPEDASPKDAAIRELSEETGIEAEGIIELGVIDASSAYSTEKIYLYAMTGLSRGKQHLDPNEAIDIIIMPFDQAFDMAAKGQFFDAKTIVGLLMAKEKLAL